MGTSVRILMIIQSRSAGFFVVLPKSLSDGRSKTKKFALFNCVRCAARVGGRIRVSAIADNESADLLACGLFFPRRCSGSRSQVSFLFFRDVARPGCPTDVCPSEFGVPHSAGHLKSMESFLGSYITRSLHRLCPMGLPDGSSLSRNVRSA